MTSDKYSDVCIPFYKLFEKYWGKCKFKIFHISENLLPNTDLPIKHIKVDSNFSWCEKLIKSLEWIESDYVLLLLADYFLMKNVDENLIDKYLEILEKNDAAFIRIFPCPGPRFDFKNYSDIGLIEKNTEYSISTQATIWNKSELLKFAKNFTDDSEMENYGSLTSSIIQKDLLSVKVINNNKNLEEENYSFTYLCTAVIQGKWNRKVKDFLKKENIYLDSNRKRQTLFEEYYYYNYATMPLIARKILYFFIK